MEKMSLYMFTAGFITLAIATVFYMVLVVSRLKVGSARLVQVEGPETGSLDVWEEPRGVGRIATIFAWNAMAFLLFTILFRTIASSRGPFSNMYEFSIAFAFGITLAYLVIEIRGGNRLIGAIALPIALGLLGYASTLPNDIAPLVPALQNNLLLTVHVSVAIIAYGFLAVSFGAAVVYLVRRQMGAGAATLESIDETGYKAVLVGFPAMALVIILGSIWAETAWGRWWGWDPKETASLFTFLLYAAYIHSRTFRGWRGTRTAAMLIIGFAAVLFTYFGNLFFGGLHSYSGIAS